MLNSFVAFTVFYKHDHTTAGNLKNAPAGVQVFGAEVTDLVSSEFFMWNHYLCRNATRQTHQLYCASVLAKTCSQSDKELSSVKRWTRSPATDGVGPHCALISTWWSQSGITWHRRLWESFNQRRTLQDVWNDQAALKNCAQLYLRELVPF